MGGWPACLLVELLVEGDNLHISLLLCRTHTQWPDYYVFRDHHNLATPCKDCRMSQFGALGTLRQWSPTFWTSWTSNCPWTTSW